MVIQASGSSYSVPSTVPAWPRSRGALCVKLCALAAAVAAVFVPVALVNNAQRNLTESIRKEEARRVELVNELNAAKVRLHRVMNASSMERVLESQGLCMITPSADQLVMVSPTAPGLPAPVRTDIPQQRAVASR